MGVMKLKRRADGETMHIARLEKTAIGLRPMALCDGAPVLEKGRGHLWTENTLLEPLSETNCFECAIKHMDDLARVGNFPKR